MGLVANKIDFFLLVLARVTGIFSTAPIFSSRGIPPQMKIGLSGLVALIIFPVVKPPVHPLPEDIWNFGLLVAGELMLGLIIGFAAQMIFAGIQLAGTAIDMQMGFAIVNVMDPMHGTPIPLIGNFKYILALLLFLTTNGHHLVLSALYHSYQLVPLTAFGFTGSLVGYMMKMAAGVFLLAVKISLPVVGALFVVDIALGLIARTVPQMNVFIVGLPLKIAVGLVVIMLSLPLYLFMMEILFNKTYSDLINLLRTI
ncbi:MAG: flagellar biosynthetic protein FliR [Clostridia bacterium]|nr:flagellar biosynthetic protein FliR [Clostridia bacterium]